MKNYIAKKNDETFKEKVTRIAHNRKEDVKDIWQNHRTEVLILGPAVLGFGTAAIKGVASQLRRRNEWKLQNLRIYDRSLDIWWDLRRKLNTEERLILNERMKLGDRLGDILHDLHVLK